MEILQFLQNLLALLCLLELEFLGVLLHLCSDALHQFLYVAVEYFFDVANVVKVLFFGYFPNAWGIATVYMVL